MSAKNGRLQTKGSAAQKLGVANVPASKKAGNAKQGAAPSGKSVHVPAHKKGGAGSEKDD